MRTLDNHGVTLVELLLTLVMAVAFAAAAHQVVRMAASGVRVAALHRGSTRDAVTFWALVNHDLRAATDSDLASPNAHTLDLSRPVGEGTICASALTSARLRWRGERSPDPGRDRAWLREDSVGGAWLERGIVSVTMANCPDGEQAVELVFAGAIPAVAVGRVVEPVRLRSYRSGADHWLGLEPRLTAATVQPLAGPIESDGFQVTLTGDAVRLGYARPPLVPLVLELPLEVSP